MIQVDVFWSWALGAQLGCAAARASSPPPPLAGPHFLYAAVFLGAVFAPSGAYLLAAFPYWESMFVFSTLADVPPGLVAAFACTNVALGVIGVWRC